LVLAGIDLGLSIKKCLKNACKASAISVTLEGAASSIPSMDEVMHFEEQLLQ